MLIHCQGNFIRTSIAAGELGIYFKVGLAAAMVEIVMRSLCLGLKKRALALQVPMGELQVKCG